MWHCSKYRPLLRSPPRPSRFRFCPQDEAAPELFDLAALSFAFATNPSAATTPWRVLSILASLAVISRRSSAKNLKTLMTSLSLRLPLTPRQKEHWQETDI